MVFSGCSCCDHFMQLGALANLGTESERPLRQQRPLVDPLSTLQMSRKGPFSMTVKEISQKHNPTGLIDTPIASVAPVGLSGWETVAAMTVIAAASITTLILTGGSMGAVAVVVAPLLLVLGFKVHRG